MVLWVQLESQVRQESPAPWDSLDPWECLGCQDRQGPLVSLDRVDLREEQEPREREENTELLECQGIRDRRGTVEGRDLEVGKEIGDTEGRQELLDWTLPVLQDLMDSLSLAVGGTGKIKILSA